MLTRAQLLLNMDLHIKFTASTVRAVQHTMGYKQTVVTTEFT